MTDLQATYDSEDAIPEAARDLYAEQNGKFVLNVDGFVPKTKLDEFRNSNRDLRKQLDTVQGEFGSWKQRFKDVDPEKLAKYQERLASIEEDEERELIAAGNLDEVIKRRTARTVEEIKADRDNRAKAYDELQKKYDALHKQFTSREVVGKFRSLLGKKGARVKPGAEEDAEMRIMADWTLDETGAPKLRKSDLVGESGGPMTEMEYVERELLGRRNWMFEGGRGGGSEGGDADDVQGGRERGVKTVARNPRDIGLNLEAIAEGKARIKR